MPSNACCTRSCPLTVLLQWKQITMSPCPALMKPCIAKVFAYASRSTGIQRAKVVRRLSRLTKCALSLGGSSFSSFCSGHSQSCDLLLGWRDITRIETFARSRSFHMRRDLRPCGCCTIAELYCVKRPKTEDWATVRVYGLGTRQSVSLTGIKARPDLTCSHSDLTPFHRSVPPLWRLHKQPF